MSRPLALRLCEYRAGLFERLASTGEGDYCFARSRYRRELENAEFRIIALDRVQVWGALAGPLAGHYFFDRMRQS